MIDDPYISPTNLSGPQWGYDWMMELIICTEFMSLTTVGRFGSLKAALPVHWYGYEWLLVTPLICMHSWSLWLHTNPGTYLSLLFMPFTCMCERVAMNIVLIGFSTGALFFLIMPSHPAYLNSSEVDQCCCLLAASRLHVWAVPTFADSVVLQHWNVLAKMGVVYKTAELGSR